jgi:hypothetical protein
MLLSAPFSHLDTFEVLAYPAHESDGLDLRWKHPGSSVRSWNREVERESIAGISIGLYSDSVPEIAVSVADEFGNGVLDQFFQSDVHNGAPYVMANVTNPANTRRVIATDSCVHIASEQ